MDQTRQERIRERAYGIWMAEGCPDGCDAQHWQQAEQELSAQADATEEDAAETTMPLPMGGKRALRAGR